VIGALRRVARCAFVALLAAGASAAGAPAERIVSTAPSLTETLFALGAGDQVVGVTTFCIYPEEARSRTKVGGFADANVEQIVALRPDLVVMVEGRRVLAERLAPFGIPTLVLDPSHLSGIFDAIRALAEASGRAEPGERLVAKIEADLAAVQRSVEGRARPRALLLVGRSPGSLSGLYAVGPASFLGELLERAGGENVLADSAAAYPKVSLEQVLARDPDVIVELIGMERGDREAFERETRELWSSHPNLTAVRRDAVRVLADDRLLQPGPRVAETIRRLAAVLHGIELP
jgi:ABC-type Fe3+-hydroxamate transport system substrate-binding protein